ncbi:MAG: hypothetical protein ACREK1_03220, partial [Longimicrobiales bacterium]
MTRFVRTLLVRGILSCFIAVPASAATQQLPTLEPADYARWESLGETELAPDGRWVAYTVSRVDGDGELRYRAVARDSTHVVEHGSRPAFSSNGRWLAYAIGYSREERERREQSGGPVRGAVGLVDLTSRVTTVIRDVADFEFSGDGSFIVLHGYADPGRESTGHDVIVQDLDRAISTSFGNVAGTKWRHDAPVLAMIIHGANRAGNGIRTFDPRTGIIRTLESDTAEYTGLAWRRDADDLAVLRVSRDARFDDPTHSVIVWRDASSRDPVRAVLDPAAYPSFPDARRIVDQPGLRWSSDGGTIFLGLREWKPKSDSAVAGGADTVAEGADTVADGTDTTAERQDTAADSAGVEVWRADDVDIVPEQKMRALFDRSRSWLAAWRVDADRFFPLADSLARDVTLSDGRYAIGIDPSPYKRERMFGPEYRDLLAIDVTTGGR